MIPIYFQDKDVEGFPFLFKAYMIMPAAVSERGIRLIIIKKEVLTVYLLPSLNSEVIRLVISPAGIVIAVSYCKFRFYVTVLKNAVRRRTHNAAEGLSLLATAE